MTTATATSPKLTADNYVWLSEASAGSSRVKRDLGLIEGCLVVGIGISKNGNEWTAEVLRRMIPLVDGVQVNLNHPSRANPSEDRMVESRFGRLINPRVDGRGLWADLRFVRSHPLAEMICEIAESDPLLIGLSVCVDGHSERRDGKTVVLEVTGVRSVDLVADPSATRGLFESVEARQLASWCFPDNAREAVRRLLASDAELGEPTMTVADAPAPPSMIDEIIGILDGTDPASEKVEAIRALIDRDRRPRPATPRQESRRRRRRGVAVLETTRREIAEIGQQIAELKGAISGTPSGTPSGSSSAWRFPKDTREGVRRITGRATIAPDEYKAMKRRLLIK